VKTLGSRAFRARCWGRFFSAGHDVFLLRRAGGRGNAPSAVSMGGALAFWMGNPLLNPATLVFMGFVLGWHFALFAWLPGC
jgi:hypothetical protein